MSLKLEVIPIPQHLTAAFLAETKDLRTPIASSYIRDFLDEHSVAPEKQVVVIAPVKVKVPVKRQKRVSIRDPAAGRGCGDISKLLKTSAAHSSKYTDDQDDSWYE